MATLGTVLDKIRPGDHVFVAGSTGEPTALLDSWAVDPERTRGLRVTTSFVPGINSVDVAGWHPTARIEGLFMQPSFRSLHAEGRYHWLPMSYGGFAKYQSERADPPATCIVQLSPPGPDGRHSLGLAAEFMPAALRRASRVIGIVNHAMPYVRRAPQIDRDQVTFSVEVETPLPRYDTGEVDPVALRIAETIASRIRDGDAVQVGIGKVPAALLAALAQHRRLRIQSGMLGDGLRLLAEAGALNDQWLHQGCVMVGSQELYEWAARNEGFAIAGCDETHNLGRLAAVERLIAVNSALEIDLSGQCNLEMAGGRAVSGAGGAPDFARAAKLSPQGLSVVALPATAKGGTVSRICPNFGASAIVSLPRYDIDMVVTEFGAVDLRGLDVIARGLSIASVAAPQFRDELSRQWREISRAM
jgi:acyl-CoA hydrolase